MITQQSPRLHSIEFNHGITALSFYLVKPVRRWRCTSKSTYVNLNVNYSTLEHYNKRRIESNNSIAHLHLIECNILLWKVILTQHQHRILNSLVVLPFFEVDFQSFFSISTVSICNIWCWQIEAGRRKRAVIVWLLVEEDLMTEWVPITVKQPWAIREQLAI